MTETPVKSNSPIRADLGSLLLFLKGVAMGLGDSVPGVSGGTIAVITNIYERLIFAIRSIDSQMIGLLIEKKIAQSWVHIDGSFLLVLALGVLSGLLVSANSVLFLLENYFEPLMAFFVGMVLASTWVLKAKFNLSRVSNCIALLSGILITLLIGSLEPQAASPNLFYVFISGAIGICAMILPGLSGAFILILMGVYQFMLRALVNFEIAVICVFILGCAIGLLSFSRVLAWLLSKYNELSFSVISGMLLGSIYVLWPWQEAVSFYSDSSGIQHPLQTVNIWPLNYTETTGNAAWLGTCLMTFAVGLSLVIALNLAFNKKRDLNV